jgi:WD40 repeat protein
MLLVSRFIIISASRDTCIKKWDLRSGELVKSLNNAHKDWICGLSFLPGKLIKNIVQRDVSGLNNAYSIGHYLRERRGRFLAKIRPPPSSESPLKY